ncbi:MAG: TIGR02757 family protein [Syntrophobacteraceae bacterium]|jgi:uncharacterized protein (TIGR02757 family)
MVCLNAILLSGGILRLKSSNRGAVLSLTPDADSGSVGGGLLATALEEIYRHYNHFEHIHPDPLEFVYLYDKKLDRELSGFIASALAYGRVRQILRSVRTVLDAMGPSPSSFLLEKSPAAIGKTFLPFKHRFTTGAILSNLLEGLRELILEYGSLESCFLAGFSEKDRNVLPALAGFVKKLEKAGGRTMPMFLPSPDGGSACKRLNLFLRWMVRSDNVDPGIWRSIPASHLIVPLDTHMHRIAGAMGLTSRKQADIRCAIEITEAFSAIRPADPVRYDFALTRLGIKPGAPPTNFFASLLSIGGEG